MLLAGTLSAVVLVWIFWPGKGLLSLLTRARMISRRVLLEDALKFIYDCEYRNIPCDLNSVAGNLSVSTDKAAKLLDRLHSMGLTEMKEQAIRLTDTGRSYSLRIIRVHRIWERYLADETGMSKLEWHGEADYREHRTSQEDADRLAARMGNPVYDPHGDPIPSPGGELPEHSGLPLSHLKEGDIARIVHIEDEPASIFEQLIALGLFPGMQVYVMDTDKGKITFAADGDECVLTPLFANSITVDTLPGEAGPAPKYELLSSLRIGEKAEIAGISPNCMGQQRRRLMDLGVVPGSVVTAEMRSASGDPVGYRIMGATIGVRKSQADLIFIDKKETFDNE